MECFFDSIEIRNRQHKINNNYIHHNQRQGLGYGVSHGKSYSLIEYNLFNFNRHSIAGSGRLWTADILHEIMFNWRIPYPIVLICMGAEIEKDGTETAGSKIIIENNTFLSSKRAIKIRGIPAEFCRQFQKIFFLIKN